MNSFATQIEPFATPLEKEGKIYDAAIIGGGLAGLALAIQLAKEDFTVIVIEKETYPFHRVCGEYISFECWNFLEGIGYPLSDMDLPVIKTLQVSAPNGKMVTHALTLGGFGISRYKIDAELALIARHSGVLLHENEKVNSVAFNTSGFTLQTAAATIKAKCVVAAFGKRSNLDVKWKRWFTRQKNNKINNYIGVKYHIQTEFAGDLIALHNFENGYCGISKIEENKFCLCYLTTAENLQRSDNSIKKMEQEILQQNPFLSHIFSSATILYEQPLTISQISFAKKSQVNDHVLLIGDAAGMVTPLCGNGMSMALHGSKIAFEYISLFLQDHLKRYEMEQQYADSWNRHFSKRLLAGRIIQRFFGNAFLSNFLLKSVKPFPKFVSYLIRQTHGEPY